MSPSTPTALITGAGSGIGRALARLLAQEGYAIAVVDLREDGMRSLAEELPGQRVAWRIADVTDATGLQEAVRELEAALGPIDLLVANAGIGIETKAVNYSAADMAKVLNVNLIGVSNSIAAVLPGMIERKRGHLVGISSIASYRGLPRMIAYSASKAGVNAIMDGLRVELTPLGVRVSTICPGWIRTPLTKDIGGDLAFILEVDEAAREIAYAIRNKLVFYTFPRPMRWRMRLLTMLPRSWQDWYITRLMHTISTKKFGVAQVLSKPAGERSEAAG
ncbi:MAG: SDR family NAD(P)-dependent oxidoreductase [Gemmataceae bacterium]|nr:SDR family NAD(P)-dependent oxidoreductase [Gemmataceae bacterium]